MTKVTTMQYKLGCSLVILLVSDLVLGNLLAKQTLEMLPAWSSCAHQPAPIIINDQKPQKMNHYQIM